MHACTKAKGYFPMMQIYGEWPHANEKKTLTII